jgi:hypothetical protein
MEDDPDILKAAGEALYGRQWQRPLSRDLCVTDRTIRNWLVGVGRPADLVDRIIPLLLSRRDQLVHLIALATRRGA